MSDAVIGEVCGPCARKGLEVEAVEDAQLWAGGPWAFLCAACAYRARSRPGRAKEAWGLDTEPRSAS